MSDRISQATLKGASIDHGRLYTVAESLAGYFTAAQALDAGMSRSTLQYHARPGGRYERIEPGLFRLRQFPSTPHEHIIAAWLGLGQPWAVVSHESALELHELADVIPTKVHITVPRSKRGMRRRSGVALHAVQHPPAPSEIQTINGIPVTRPDRSILDSIDAGTQPEQIEAAISQAIARGWTTPRRLQAASAGRSVRARDLVTAALRDASRDLA